MKMYAIVIHVIRPKMDADSIVCSYEGTLEIPEVSNADFKVKFKEAINNAKEESLNEAESTTGKTRKDHSIRAIVQQIIDL